MKIRGKKNSKFTKTRGQIEACMVGQWSPLKLSGHGTGSHHSIK